MMDLPAGNDLPNVLDKAIETLNRTFDRIRAQQPQNGRRDSSSVVERILRDRRGEVFQDYLVPA